jgi:hypothetical protein
VYSSQPEPKYSSDRARKMAESVPRTRIAGTPVAPSGPSTSPAIEWKGYHPGPHPSRGAPHPRNSEAGPSKPPPRRPGLSDIPGDAEEDAREARQ